MFDELSRLPEKDSKSERRRAVILLASAAITVMGLSVALLLGNFGYHYRRASRHEKRLVALLEAHSSLPQVIESLRQKAPLLVSPDTEEELRPWASASGPAREAKALEKYRRWQRVHLFDAGDMLYFIYFDGTDVMRDFIYADKPSQ